MSDSVEIVAQLGGELVTYTPYGGAAKTFKAIVERRPTQVDGTGGFPFGANTLEVFIPKDTTDGMTAIQPRKDRMRFKKHLSDADATDFTVTLVMQEDAGLVASDGGGFRVLVQS